jgi:hypothetical protein
MTMTKGDKRDKKRAYHKPQLEQVELVPEEAVLGGCKTHVDTGPSDEPGFTGCGGVLNQCDDLLFS